VGQAVGGGVDLRIGSPDVFVNQGDFIGEIVGAGLKEMMDECWGIHRVLYLTGKRGHTYFLYFILLHMLCHVGRRLKRPPYDLIGCRKNSIRIRQHYGTLHR